MSSQKMKAVLQKSPGGPDSLYVGEAGIPQVKEGWLLIKSHATALNRADTMQREGKYPPPPGASQIIGLEVAGEVHEVGPGVDKFKKVCNSSRHRPATLRANDEFAASGWVSSWQAVGSIDWSDKLRVVELYAQHAVEA